MGIMMLVWIIVLVALGLVVVRLVTQQLPPPSTSEQDRRLAQQAEQIEQLEDELRQVKEQADFTEKLLTERSETEVGEADQRESTD